MVRMTVFVKAKDGLDHEAFLEHWRTRHGPLIAGTPSLARHIVRYEQHALADVPPWAGTAGYDGVAVQWFRSFQGFLDFLAEPAYGELIAPDEERFLDRDAVLWLFSDEDDVAVMIDGDPDASTREGDDHG